MEHELDVRGARCPVPYVRARQRVGELGPGDALTVRFTDPEAPVDLGALAADEGLEMVVAEGAVTLRRPRHPGAGRPPR